MLHVVQLGELAAIVGRDVLLKLLQRLPPQVAAIDQEQHALRARELDQAIDERHRRERLAAARRHLDQRPRSILRQRSFQILDRFDLRRPQARSSSAAAGCRKRARNDSRLARPLRQRLRSMKRKRAAAARLGIESVGEERLDAGALVEERQRRMPRGRSRGQAHAVLLGLRLDAGQRRPLRPSPRSRQSRVDRRTADNRRSPSSAETRARPRRAPRRDSSLARSARSSRIAVEAHRYFVGPVVRG